MTLPPCPWEAPPATWTVARCRAGAARLGAVVPLDGLDALAATAQNEPAVAAWLDGATAHLALGAWTDPADWPQATEHPDLAPIWLAAFLATVPEALGRLRGLGLDDAVAEATLLDLARWTAVWRRRQGAWGLGEIGWLSRHWRAGIVELGRLQFEAATWRGPRCRIGTDVLWPGRPIISVHIPEGGPLSAEACEDAFARAAVILPRIWKIQADTPVVCQSWLFDPWLREALPPTANLLRFQDLWSHRPGWSEDRSLLRYCFDREGVTAGDDLPRDTTLRRAAADRLAAGGTWVGGVGMRAWPWTEKPVAAEAKDRPAPALVVLAAGLGSRFGGDKQVAAVGPRDETILAFTAFDARRAGFAEVILVVRPGMEDTVRALVADRIGRQIPVRLVPQPLGRPRPWGTAHALACALEGLHRPCGVVNADDWYGVDGIRRLAEGLTRDDVDGVCVTYPLGRTLSAHGGVNRAVCAREDGLLVGIEEVVDIRADARGISAPTGPALRADTAVSLNCWGFQPWTYPGFRRAVADFLASDPEPKAECFLPTVIMDHIRAGSWRIAALSADSDWCGLTYAADRAAVAARLRQATTAGDYPEPLWAEARGAHA